jgi:peptidoglycan/LPS O-acetylase OafA/YrhL
MEIRTAARQAAHRTDIDGLRTLAVLPVVMFHYMMISYAPGGFIGVDVFFVISGFLITKLIYDGIALNSFSIAEFYNRRVRRIFPALFFMYAAIIVASSFLFFPSEVASTAKSLVASAVFVSNMLFNHMTSYFDDKLKMNPLLHTWSLSVEEQFYIAFPILVYLLKRFAHRTRIIVIGAAAAGSFAASVWMVAVHAPNAFYLMQFRAWELLMGSLLAIGAVPALISQRLAEILAAAGVALILGSVMLLKETTPFPGLAAAPACLGTALVLYAGMDHITLTGRALSLPPIRFVGLISYSLYLWHWPVLVFFRAFREPHGAVEKLLLIGLSMALATVSWRFVERPFRRPPFRTGVKGTLVAAGLAAIAVAGVALATLPLNTMLRPLPPEAAQVLAYTDYAPGRASRMGTCFVADGTQRFDEKTCLTPVAGEKNYLIMGDSHGAHFWAGLSEAYPDVHFLQATAAGCKPVLNAEGDGWCTALMRAVIEDFLPKHHLDGIILSARWVAGQAEDAKRTAEALRAYADRVIVFGPIVEYDQALPRLLARGILVRDSDLPRHHLVSGPQQADRVFAQTLKAAHVPYISIYGTVCAPSCRLWASDDVPLQYDYGHLTEAGSRAVARLIGEALFGAHDGAATR